MIVSFSDIPLGSGLSLTSRHVKSFEVNHFVNSYLFNFIQKFKTRTPFTSSHSTQIYHFPNVNSTYIQLLKWNLKITSIIFKYFVFIYYFKRKKKKKEKDKGYKHTGANHIPENQVFREIIKYIST